MKVCVLKEAFTFDPEEEVIGDFRIPKGCVGVILVFENEEVARKFHGSDVTLVPVEK